MSGNKQNLLSIIIPVLEPDNEFFRCIACIKALGLDEDEVHIALVVPKTFSKSTQMKNPNLSYVQESRSGIYSAMNDGIRKKQSRYLYFLGKDDIILPGFKEAIDILKHRKPRFLSCDTYWGTKGIYSGSPSKYRLLARNLCHQGIFYERETLLKSGLFNTKMNVQADHYSNIKILWNTPSALIEYLPIPICVYSGSGYSSRVSDRTFRKLYPTILNKHVGKWAKLALIATRLIRGRL